MCHLPKWLPNDPDAGWITSNTRWCHGQWTIKTGDLAPSTEWHKEVAGFLNNLAYHFVDWDDEYHYWYEYKGHGEHSGYAVRCRGNFAISDTQQPHVVYRYWPRLDICLHGDGSRHVAAHRSRSH